MPTTHPTKAPQTVTPDGKSVKPLIDGVLVQYPVTHEDDRGSLCEIYHPSWHFDQIPLTNAYLVTIHVGKVKGWAVHDKQVDRYFFARGHVKLVLYDNREDSPTYKMLNELYFSEQNQALVLVPPGIYHAVENVGNSEGLLFNIPSEPYNHTNPDKHTLPLKNDLIPHDFQSSRGC